MSFPTKAPQTQNMKMSLGGGPPRHLQGWAHRKSVVQQYRIPLSYPKMHCVKAKSSVPAIAPCSRSWFRGDRLAILIALLLALLSAPQRGERRRLGAARSTPSVRGRRFPTPVRAPVQVPRQLYDWIGRWYWQSFWCNQTKLIPHFGTMQPIWSRCI